MANRYWVGGSGTWDTSSTTNWSATSGGTAGASAPTSADSVFFDQNATYTVTVNIQCNCLDFTVSTGSVTFNNATTNVYGNISWATSTVAYNATGVLNIYGTGTKTMATNGNTVNVPTINFVGTASYTLSSDFTTGTTGNVTFTSGSIVLNGFTFTCSAFISNNSNTRSISFGANNIVLSNAAASTAVVSINTATGFTWTGTGGFVSDANVARSFYFGGTAGGDLTNGPNLKITTGASALTIGTGNGSWWNTLDFTGYTGQVTLSGTTFCTAQTAIIGTGMTFFGTSTFTIVSASQTITCGGNYVRLVNVNLPGLTWNVPLGLLTYQLTLTAGTLNLNGNDLAVSIFASDNSNVRSVNFGSNKIILGVYGPGATSGNLTMATVTNFTFSLTGTGGFYFNNSSSPGNYTYGSTAGGSVANAPNVYVYQGASTFTAQAASWFNLLDTTGFSGQIASNSFNTSNLTLSATTSLAAWTTSTIVTLQGTGTIKTNGNSGITNIVMNHTGTTTLGDSLTLTTNSASSKFTLTQGTLNLNGFDLTCAVFSSSNTNVRSVNFGTNKIYLNCTASTTVLDMATATAFTVVATTGGFARNVTTITATFTFGTTGGTSSNAPSLRLDTGTNVLSFTSGSYFNKLDFGTANYTPSVAVTLNVNSLVMAPGGTWTNVTINMIGTGTLSSNGATTYPTITINHSGTTTLASAVTMSATSIFSLTSGTLALAGFTLTCGIFYSTNTNVRAITFGTGNIALAHTTAGSTVLDITTATNFSCTTTGGGFTSAMSITRTFTVGTTGGTISNSPNLSLISGSAVPTLTSGSWFNKLDFTGCSGQPPAALVNLNSLILDTAGLYNNLTAAMRGTGTVSTNNTTTLGSLASLIIINISGTTTFAAAVKCISFTMTSGNVDFATFNLTCVGALASVAYTAGNMLNIGTITCATFTVTGTLTFTQGTIVATTSFTLSSGAFNYNGGDLSSITSFIHTAGTVTLGAALTLAATSTYTFTADTLALAGFNLTIGTFTSSNSNTRTISFGSGNIVLAHTTAAQTVLFMVTATSFTYTGTGGFVTDASVTRTLAFGSTAGGTTANAPNITLTGSGTAVLTFTSNSYFNKLDFGTTAFAVPTATLNLISIVLSPSGTFTSLTATMLGNGTVNTGTNTTLGALNINSLSTSTTSLANNVIVSATGTTTVVSGTLNLNGFNLTTGIFNSTGTSTRAITFGANNIILNHTTAGTTVLDLTNSTGLTWTGTGGFVTDASITRTLTSATGVGSITNPPNLTFTGTGSAAITFTTSTYYNILDFGTIAAGLAVAATVLASTVILSASGTFTLLTISLRGTGTIRFNGKKLSTCTVSSTANTTVLDAASVTNFTVSGGTIDFAFFSLTCSSSYIYNSGTVLNLGTVNCVSLTINGTYTITTGMTILPTTNITIAVGGTLNYNGGTLGTSVTNFSHAGTFNLGTAYSIATTGIYTLTTGTLNLNGFDLTVGGFSSTGTGTRSINFGTNNIILNLSTLTPAVIDMADVTGFTVTATTGGFVTDTSIARTLTFGTTSGSITNSCNVTLTGTGAAGITLTTGSWFNKLDFGTSATDPGLTTLKLNSLVLSAGGSYATFTPTMVGTGTVNTNGNTTLLTLVINNVSGTTTMNAAATLSNSNASVNLTSGTLDLGGFTLSTYTFVSNNSNTRSIVFGTSNIVLISTTLAQTVLSMPNLTGFSFTGTGGFTASATNAKSFDCGSTTGSYTLGNGPNLTFTGTGSAVITFTSSTSIPQFGNLDFGTIAATVATGSLFAQNITLSSTGTFTGLTVYLGNSTTTYNTSIRSNGRSIAGFIIGGTATCTLLDALTVVTTGTTTLSGGTLNLNGFDLTTGIFSSSTTTARSLTFGSNNIVLIHTTAGTAVLAMGIATGFTCSGTGGFTAAMTTTRTFTFGTTNGSISNAPNLSITSGASTATLTDGSWFKALNFTGSSCAVAVSASSIGINIDTLTLTASGTYTSLIPVFTRTQTWTSQFSQPLGGIGFNLAGGTLTLDNTQTYTTTALGILTNGTLDLGGYDLTLGVFTSNNSNTRTISFGANNIIVTTPTAAQTNINIGTSTGFSFTGTGGFISDAAVTRTFTLNASSNATAVDLTLVGSGTAVLTFTTGGKFDKLDFGTTAFNPGTTALSVNSLILSAGGTFSGLTPTMWGTGTLKSNGNLTLTALIINGTGITTTLGDTLTLTSAATTTLTAGTLDLNGFNLTTGIFSSTGAVTRAITFGTGNIILNTTTAGSTVLSMATVTGFTNTGTGGFVTDASITRTLVFGTTGGTASNAPNLLITSGAAVITLTTGSWFDTLDLSGTSTTPPITSLNVSSFYMGTGSYSAVNLSTVGTGSIKSNGNSTLVSLSVNGIGITTTLLDALTLIGNTSTLLLLAGTLNLSGFNVTTGTFLSNYSSTRSINFGSGNIYLLGASTTVLSMASATGFTCTGTGGFVADASSARTYTFGTTGGTSSNAPNLTLTGTGVSIATLTTGSFFNKLDFGTTAFNPGTTILNLNGLTLSSTGVYTTMSVNFLGTGTFTPNGIAIAAITVNNGTGTITAAGAMSGTTFAMTAGTIDFALFNLTCSSTFTYTSGSMLNMGTITCTTFTVNGTFTMVSGTVSPSVSFVLQSGAFNYNGGTLSAVPTLTHTAGTLTLGKAYALTATGTYTLTAGTLNLNGFDLTTGIFSSSNANTRSITFGTNNIILAHTTAATTVLVMGAATGFTITSTSTGGFVTDASTTRTLVFGTSAGSATNSPNLTLTGSGASVVTLTTGSFFNKLDFGTTAFTLATATLNLNSLVLSTGGIFTGLTLNTVGTGSITSNGKSIISLTVNCPGGTTTFNDLMTFTAATATTTLTAGALTLNGFNLTTGIFSSSNTNTRSVNFGSNNIILAHTTAATTVLGMATATGFTYTGTGGVVTDASVTRTLVFGTTGGSATTSPNVTLTGSGTAIITLTTGSWFNKLDFGTTAFAIAVTALNLNGLVLSTGGTYTSLTPTMVGTGTLNTNGKTLTTLTINSVSGTTTMAGAVSTSTSTTLTSGTLALAGFTLTPTQFISGAAASRAISGSGTGIISLANDWTVTDGTGFTGSDYKISMTKATAKTFAGAGGSYGTLIQAGAGALTITGSNGFADIQASTRPSTISFTAGTTQTVSAFTLSGTLGNLVTINSVTSGSQFTLSKASGTVTVSYLSIKDSNVTGGATWYNNNGTNTVLTNNTGWNGPGPVSAVNGQFMAFF